MPDEVLTCIECGRRYRFTETDRLVALEIEALAEAEATSFHPREFCPDCRPKQDDQRA